MSTKHKGRLLEHTNTNRQLTADPTKECKAKLINLLSKIKKESGLGEKNVQEHVSPKFCGLPKINKMETPLQPIVSSEESVTYGAANELARILKSLMGQSTHQVHNTQEFIEHTKNITSYDLTALFTSLPEGQSIKSSKTD